MNNDLIQVVNQPTDKGRELLKSVVTNISGNVYGFWPFVPASTVAAAMARLSRSPEDLRNNLLLEFPDEIKELDQIKLLYEKVDQNKSSDLMKRVLTAYGDDSVQQLLPIQLVIENTSNLMTKTIEWHRLGAYLEQSTRYIYFDQKQNGRYRYHTPEELSQADQKFYNSSMDLIFDNYSSLVTQLTNYIRVKNPKPIDKTEILAWTGATRAQACDAARPLFPVATTSTVGVVANAQTIEYMIVSLLSNPLTEAQKLGLSILKEVRKIYPVFFERADMPGRGLALSAYKSEIARELSELSKSLPLTRGANFRPVRLLNTWPDFDQIYSNILFDQTKLDNLEIKNITDNYSPEEKQNLWDTFVGKRMNRRHKPGRALELIHYEWEIVGDYGTFRDLQRHRIVDDMRWQKLSPNLGYQIPELVIESGLENLYRSTVDLSERLYNHLIQNYNQTIAQYACLLTHNMRYRFVINARSLTHLLEIRTTPQGHPGYRKICQEMYNQVMQATPEVAKMMKFVNKGEDPELTRLASEQATVKRLEELTRQ
ncbi:FAD-dependent thymidylate synthase [Candidatus Saccharibacteria bacterium]|nr:FAD-dependent thymidylate synthase [Candidatus Saccharibacteria bacterium]MCB9834892.1 FAD-dependent thymidylate synthase [Candidatus Nomurabacteria bacterium]